jgi:phosphatidylglycerol---prolipoprotein diacylglyceryl transferase
MHFPVYFEIGPLALHAHWVFESIAYTAGFYLYRRHRRRFGDPIDSRSRWYVTAAAIAGGFIGSRVLSAFEDPFTLAAHWRQPFQFFAGKTIVGGLGGGWLAVEWVKRVLGVRIATGDLLALPLVLGIAIGRIGCFLSGLEDQSYGVSTTLPWSVDFGDGVRRHPTQLYELLFLAGLAAVLLLRTGRMTTIGDRFKLFLFGYMGFRLLVDFIKPAVRVGGLSAIQWTCLAAVAYYAPHLPRLVTAVRRG